tara:strand:+ start:124 stop:786 length:663 start_codon:yes stop_codon:yes gene_type:complete
MINNHLTIPFEFYCLTDNSDGLYNEVSVLDLEIEEGLKGWWYKLQLFKKDFYGLTGQAMFLDLDVVIINNIDALFETRNDDFMIIRDLKPGKIYNSSVFKLELGSQPHVWNQFLLDKESIISRMHGDQDWISEVVNDAKLWPNNWVVSFKKECDARTKYSFGSLGRFLRSKGFFLPKGDAVPPKEAKIVYFHGKPDPHDVADQPYDMWKKAPWIKKEWEV